MKRPFQRDVHSIERIETAERHRATSFLASTRMMTASTPPASAYVGTFASGSTRRRLVVGGIRELLVGLKFPTIPTPCIQILAFFSGLLFILNKWIRKQHTEDRTEQTYLSRLFCSIFSKF